MTKSVTARFAPLAIFLSSASGAALAAPSDAPTLIQNAQVFDGVRAVGRHTVLIADGKIANPDFKGKAPAGATIVDGSGKTLMPGLIDAHVHAIYDLATPLLFGVTTQLDMFSAPKANSEIKAATRAGTNREVADLYTSGYLATAPGGHGTEYGLPVPTLIKPEQADAWVAARIAEGSDYIKIIDEPGSSFGRKLPTLDVATIRALVVAAHKRGKLAVVHVQDYASAVDVLDAGADGLAHLFIDKEADASFANLAKEKHAFIVPTMSVFEVFSGRSGGATLLDTPALSGLLGKQAVTTLKTQIGQDRSAQFDTRLKASMAALLKAGVPILAGTDSGNPGTWYGLSLHRELDLLVSAGLTPSQALTAATSATAKAFRLTDRGRIAKRLVADLVLVDGDPTRDIKAAHNIVEVWKGGHAASGLRAARRAEIASAANAPTRALVTLPADGRIGRFARAMDGKVEMKAPFGAGWVENSDTQFGGNSTVRLEVGGTAPGGETALVMSGEVKPGAFAQWAGIGFMPGARQFAPGNISGANALKFRARGEGPGFGTMAFSEASGQRPVTMAFAVTNEWSEVVIKFADLKGFDPAGAMLLTISALKPGPYRLEVADVRLVKE
jgi:imidazolonepropionase-like amidohydrolase